jgi:hypothetical protein
MRRRIRHSRFRTWAPRPEVCGNLAGSRWFVPLRLFLRHGNQAGIVPGKLFAISFQLVYRFPQHSRRKPLHLGYWGLGTGHWRLLVSTSHPSNPIRQNPTAFRMPCVLAICGIVNMSLPA